MCQTMMSHLARILDPRSFVGTLTKRPQTVHLPDRCFRRRDYRDSLTDQGDWTLSSESDGLSLCLPAAFTCRLSRIRFGWASRCLHKLMAKRLHTIVQSLGARRKLRRCRRQNRGTRFVTAYHRIKDSSCLIESSLHLRSGMRNRKAGEERVFHVSSDITKEPITA
jgi:hypothetical protein